MSCSILYIGEFELPDGNASGTRVLANCKLLSLAGYNSIAIYGLNKLQPANTGLIETEIMYSGNVYRLFENRYPSSRLEWFRYITQIDKIKEIVSQLCNVSIIIAYNYPSVALNFLRKYCLDHRITLVTDVSEWYGRSKRKFPSNLVKDLDTFLRMRYVNKLCGKIICSSTFLDDYYSKGRNSIILPTLVDGPGFYSDIHINQPDSDVKSYAYIGSPGKSAEKDRLDWIVDSFQVLQRKSPKFKLIIAGIDKPTYFEIYPGSEKKVVDLENRIDFLGKVPRSKAIELSINSDFTIFCRQRNRVTSAGFPTKLAESFACFTPVVTTPSSDIQDYMVNGKSGFVSDECTSESFKVAVENSLGQGKHDVLEMQKWLRDHNPLSIINFIEKMVQFLEK